MLAMKERLELAEMGEALAEVGSRLTSVQRRLSSFVKSLNDVNMAIAELTERIESLEGIIQAAIEAEDSKNEVNEHVISNSEDR